MAFSARVGRAIDSIDSFVEKLIRIVKTMQEDTTDEHRKPNELPDLLKDIQLSKMTLCEIQLDSTTYANGQNAFPCGQSNGHSCMSDVHGSPVPCAEIGEETHDTVDLNQGPKGRLSPVVNSGESRTLDDSVSTNDQNRSLNSNIFFKKPAPAPRDNANHELDSNHDHHKHELTPMDMDIVHQLRQIGDRIKLDKEAKRSIMQSLIPSLTSNFPISFTSIDFINNRSMKEATDFCLRLVSEYNRL